MFPKISQSVTVCRTWSSKISRKAAASVHAAHCVYKSEGRLGFTLVEFRAASSVCVYD